MIDDELRLCAAYTVGDQKMCPRCGLAWDIADPRPPGCNPPVDRALPAVAPRRPGRHKLPWDRRKNFTPAHYLRRYRE